MVQPLLEYGRVLTPTRDQQPWNSAAILSKRLKCTNQSLTLHGLSTHMRFSIWQISLVWSGTDLEYLSKDCWHYIHTNSVRLSVRGGNVWLILMNSNALIGQLLRYFHDRAEESMLQKRIWGSCWHLHI